MNSGLTEEEYEIMELIIKAHNYYITLDSLCNGDLQEWVHYIHGLQGLISLRSNRRDYPEYYRIK